MEFIVIDKVDTCPACGAPTRHFRLMDSAGNFTGKRLIRCMANLPGKANVKHTLKTVNEEEYRALIES